MQQGGVPELLGIFWCVWQGREHLKQKPPRKQGSVMLLLLDAAAQKSKGVLCEMLVTGATCLLGGAKVGTAISRVVTKCFVMAAGCLMLGTAARTS